MRTLKRLMVEQLDRKLDPFMKAGKIQIPEKGWIYTIRKTLNMTLEQLGKRLNISKQGVKRIEESEASGSISLNLLKEAGRAMEMKLVYGFVPEAGSIDQLIDKKANELAKRIVLRTDHNMMLENQATGRDSIKKSIEELASEFKREIKRSLWD